VSQLALIHPFLICYKEKHGHRQLNFHCLIAKLPPVSTKAVYHSKVEVLTR